MPHYATYRCPQCNEINGTTYPSPKDLEIVRSKRENTPLIHVSHDLYMWTGLRRCKHCKAWLVLVFSGWYYRQMLCAYLPYKTEYTGSLGVEVALFVIRDRIEKKLYVPKELKDKVKLKCH